MWKKQLHCISQKIFLTGVDSEIKCLLDYVMLNNNNITLFDAAERKFNYIKCREGMIKNVVHLIWRLIS